MERESSVTESIVEEVAGKFDDDSSEAVQFDSKLGAEFSKIVDEYFDGMHSMPDVMRSFIYAQNLITEDSTANAKVRKELWEEFNRVLYRSSSPSENGQPPQPMD
jgi:hypothetical protein